MGYLAGMPHYFFNFMDELNKEWAEAQHFERDWWGDCINTFGEEIKQINYAQYMNITTQLRDSKPVINNEGKSVLDIGGGPASMLLKCINKGRSVVVDPLLNLPKWVLDRYASAGIEFYNIPGEAINSGLLALNLNEDKFDEVWIYNVLQHTSKPSLVLENAKKMGKLIRIFEWVNTPPHKGHPHELKPEVLDKILGGEGDLLDMKKIKANWSQYPLGYYGSFEVKE